MRKIKRSFTLVELLVVIAILAILATAAIVGYSSYVKKAHLSNDKTLVKLINDFLVDDEVYGIPNTMYEAKQQLLNNQHGIDISAPKISTQGYHIGYDVKQNRVVLLKSLTGTDLVEAPDGYVMGNPLDVFVAVSAYTDDCIFSEYFTKECTERVINANRGIDTGDCYTITTINYSNDEGVKDVVIRTNSTFTTLNINDQTNSEITHYDVLGQLNIQQCAMNSYYENGIVTYATITKGHLVVENNGEIELLYKNSTLATDAQAEKIDNGVIHHAHANSQTLAANKDDNNANLNVVFDYPTYEGDADTTIHHPDGEEYDVEVTGNKMVLNARTSEVKTSNNVPNNAVACVIEENLFYTTLNAAFDKANTMDSSNVVVLKNCDFTSWIPVRKNIVLNANGKTITNNCNNDGIWVLANGHLTVNGNGNFVGSSTAGDLIMIQGSDNESEKATCLIENGSFISSHVPINCGINNGTNTRYRELTINDGYFKTTSTGYGCYAILCYGNNSIVNMLGGTIEAFGTSTNYGNYGMCVFAGGVLNLGNEDDNSGPTIISEMACIATNGLSAPYTINIYGGNYSTVNPVSSSGHDDRLVIQISTVSTEQSTCTIYGGTFIQNSSDGHIFGCRYAGNKTITINGGTFSSNSYMIAYRRDEAKTATTIVNNTAVNFTDGVY